MRGKLSRVVTSAAAVVIAAGLTGCSSVRGDAEQNLRENIDDAVASVGFAAPRASTVEDFDGHLTFADQSAAVPKGSLDLVATGWYDMQDRPGGWATIDVLAVGSAFGNEGLAYTDALVFRCVRITTRLGVKDTKVHADKIDCPAEVRKAAHIIPDNPEV